MVSKCCFLWSVGSSFHLRTRKYGYLTSLIIVTRHIGTVAKSSAHLIAIRSEHVPFFSFLAGTGAVSSNSQVTPHHMNGALKKGCEWLALSKRFGEKNCQISSCEGNPTYWIVIIIVQMNDEYDAFKFLLCTPSVDLKSDFSSCIRMLDWGTHWEYSM